MINMDSENKYCYRCGTKYKGAMCPECGTTMYTTKPNSQTGKVTVPIERIIKQEKNLFDFEALEKRMIIAIVGVGGRLVSRLHDEMIFEIPKDTSLDEVRRIMCTRDNISECPACDAGIPTVEKHREDYMQIIDERAQQILYGTGISTPVGILDDLHSRTEAFKEIEKLADEDLTPPRKKNNIPKPYKRKGKFKYGWK